LSSDELLDLLDDNGHVIGTIWRSASDETRNIRSVNAFVKNEADELFIPRRTAHKARFPGALDFSVGGCVQAGEHYDDALRREASEELNLEVDACGFHKLAEFSPHTTDLSSFMAVYEIRTNRTPQLNSDDFSGAEWLSCADLRTRLNKKDAAKGDLLNVLKLLSM